MPLNTMFSVAVTILNICVPYMIFSVMYGIERHYGNF